MIKNIIFDIGEVLVDFAWREHMRALGFSEEKISILDERWVGGEMWQELDRGVLSESEAIEAAQRAIPECEEEIRVFWETPDGIIRCREQSAPWLRSLKERGYSVYLLSNYPESFFEAHLKDFTFIPYVDGRVVSCYVKVIKPDERIYRELLDRYSLIPEECVFIDDREENIEGAQKLGINGILFCNMEQAITQLDRLLESNG